MRILLAVVLALALPAAILADFDCDGCDLSQTFRIKADYEDNDDESFFQRFDGRVAWRERWGHFKDIFDEGADDIMRQECKKAIPERVYNYRYERAFNDNQEYGTTLYLWKGFVPAEDDWDRWCRKTIEGTIAFVSSSGRESIDALRYAKTQFEGGTVVMEDNGLEDKCEVTFHVLGQETSCLGRNENNRFPTDSECPQFTTAGGIRSLARYGCHQDTWDSDTNDDNIESGRCNTMYFSNTYKGTIQTGDDDDNFKPGSSVRPFFGETNPETPDLDDLGNFGEPFNGIYSDEDFNLFCEYPAKASSPFSPPYESFFKGRSINAHRCN